MTTKVSGRASPSCWTVLALLALYGLEAAAFVLAMALYKYGPRLPTLTTREAALILVPLACALVCGAGLAQGRRRLTGRQLALCAATNVVTVLGLAVVLEVGIRLFAVRTPAGVVFAQTVLLPKDWDEVRRRQLGLLQSAPANISYFVSDDLLGWTVGRGRRSADGLYLSSVEGIRSPRSDTVYADRRAAYRIATIGDSFTFALEVPFEDSWGAALEQALGPEVTVRNFGVDGYGVDQALLRYERDARPWRPTVALFGFIEHDLYRSMVVYPFISFPEWGFPFTKPRYAVHADGLRLLNTPLLSPAALLAKGSVAELPFVQHDPGYRAADWQWRFYHASYLFRFLASRFPRSAGADPGAATEVHRINRELLLTFVRRAAEEGTQPIVVYFPSRGDFEGQDRSAKEAVLASLAQAGVRYVDLTSCIRAADPARAFIPHRAHYSTHGNAAVAHCLEPEVRARLPRGK